MKTPAFSGMYSRRNFVGQMAGGIAGTLAAPGHVLGAGRSLRVGLIGAGERGQQLAREATSCDSVELTAVADVWQAQRERAVRLAPDAKIFASHQELLRKADVDAVIVATPPHLHAAQFVDSIASGKHVYVERVLAFDAAEAIWMREAWLNAGCPVVQVGHQFCSSGQLDDAARFLDAGWLGQITAIRAHMDRNAPRGKLQWSRPVPPTLASTDLNWNAFLGEAPAREFEADRFVNWRLYEDYSGGAVFEGMSQQLAIWNRLLDLPIPEAVTMTGGVYTQHDGREVPDTINVSMEYSSGLLFTWSSSFGNNQFGTGEHVLGTDGTIQRAQQIRYLPQKINRREGREVLGRTPTEPRAHMANFIDSVRGMALPNCPLELGVRVAVASRMALDSWRLRRTVYWDADREVIT